jgi:hypothetical protein
MLAYTMHHASYLSYLHSIPLVLFISVQSHSLPSLWSHHSGKLGALTWKLGNKGFKLHNLEKSCVLGGTSHTESAQAEL